MKMLALISSDIRAKAVWLYEDTSPQALLKAWLTDGTFAMVVYRLMQAAHRCHLSPLVMLFNKINTVFGKCIIGRGAEFGPGFVLVHSHGVVINGSVRGGSGVMLEHLVTIGAAHRESPTLGDNVFVGAGAKIVGDVTIGSNVKIGANAVVTKDIPDNTTAVGIPAHPLTQADPGQTEAREESKEGAH